MMLQALSRYAAFAYRRAVGGRQGPTLPSAAALPRGPEAALPAVGHLFGLSFSVPSPFFSSSMGGGSLPYLARYWAAHFSFSSGAQRKPWYSGRSSSLHPSACSLP